MSQSWFLMLITCLCLADGGNYARAEPGADVVRWGKQVVSGAEFGEKKKGCHRWVKSPNISVFGASREELKIVTEVVKHLNRTLAKTRIRKMKLVKPNDKSAEIRVIFAPLKEFPAIAKKYKFRYVQGNYGFFYTSWNGKSEIYRAYVLLASDKLRGNKLRHFALEEITQTLGLSNDSPIFPYSIFFAKGKNGGNAHVLSYRDQILIQIFYNHISPGEKSSEVEAALRKHWPKSK